MSLILDGSGEYEVSTGIGMLDHLLESLARHALFDLKVAARGDTERDTHHLAEDIGIMLGRALNEALGERRGITRFGHAILPLDEAVATVAVDLGGRPYARVELPFIRDLVGELPTENVAHLLESFASEGRFNLHLKVEGGGNDHHVAEAAMKALARALRDAVGVDPRAAGEIPSTKNVL
jgi:imidazoleglycerol-phosphate dehydratase